MKLQNSTNWKPKMTVIRHRTNHELLSTVMESEYGIFVTWIMEPEYTDNRFFLLHHPHDELMKIELASGTLDLNTSTPYVIDDMVTQICMEIAKKLPVAERSDSLAKTLSLLFNRRWFLCVHSSVNLEKGVIFH